MKIEGKIRRSFKLQRNQSDCGIACLGIIINYHGGEANLEKIRIQSGTNSQGTTLLGLYQASNQNGFKAEGLKADIAFLRKIKHPVILHVVTRGIMLHYVVVYKCQNNNFLVGDPAIGIKWMEEKEIIEIWQSNTLLTLKPLEDTFLTKKSEEKNKWKWFVGMIKEDEDLLITIFLAGIVVAILGLSTAVFAQVLIDRLIPSGDLLRIFLPVVLITFLLFAKNMMDYFRQNIMLKQGFGINIRITDYFLSNLFKLPLSFFHSRKAGDMIVRLNDIAKIQTTVTYLAGELHISTLVALVSLFAVFIYSYQIGLIVLTGVPLFAFIAIKFQSPILIGQREMMSAYSLNESNYINSINNMQIVKSFGKETLFSRGATTVFSFYQEKALNIGKVGVSIQLFTGMAALGITIAFIIVSILQMLDGSMTTGEFMALFTLTASILPSFATIAFANVQLQGARVAFERMYEFSGMEKEYHPKNEKLKKNILEFSHLRFNGVSFRYPGSKLILQDINFTIQKGELITIFGDNGTGKTTIFNLTQRFFPPESGEISVNDSNLADISLPGYRKLIGLVPQEVTLTNGSLLANITLSERQEDAMKAIEKMKMYNLLSYFEKFPQGLNTIVGEGGVKISGGQKQLVGLARALIYSPQLLLLDEVTAHMDKSTENFTLSLINNLKDQMAIIHITHNIRNAAISDKILILKNGSIEAAGSHAELLKSENYYSNSWHEFLSV